MESPAPHAALFLMSREPMSQAPSTALVPLAIFSWTAKFLDGKVSSCHGPPHRHPIRIDSQSGQE
jgi:hypothetical protein